mgnify:CR=1 FL=1
MAERLLNAFCGLLVGILAIMFLGVAALVIIGLSAVHPMLAWAGASVLLICVFLGWSRTNE